MMIAFLFSLLISAGGATQTPTPLHSATGHPGQPVPEAPSQLQPKAFQLLPLGTIAPGGWLLEQLVRQANSLAGYLSVSTFPGADKCNSSLWIGGDGSKAGGTQQWLPYLTNGNVPLMGLIDAAKASDKLDKALGLPALIDGMMAYVLAHTNKTNGWIGPFKNEPGDNNGHGLWDPLNMLRTLINYAQSHPSLEKRVAAATVAHLTEESLLLKTDPVYKWAQTRWPTFVEIAQYVIDMYIPKYGHDAGVMPLGADATRQMLLNASVLFSFKGMPWKSYYHQTGHIKFPEGPVNGWNTNDHGVNNAEGALRWPAVTWRMTGNQSDADDMSFALHMLDTYQGQPNALFCADEVFCGRAPHRGTETCAVVEAMASLEYAFEVFGTPDLMDRVERLAFNAMPAALTADMWTHVYVQQANSVFAGRTGPRHPDDPSLRHHALDTRHGAHAHPLGDSPSGEDQGANYYGVSHFPCCITNFPQGWPKFGMHTVLGGNDNSFVVASFVSSTATLPDSIGGGAKVVVDSDYPFGDDVTVTVSAPKPTTALLRIPGWAAMATVDGQKVENGTLFKVACKAGSTVITIALNPEVKVQKGWGPMGEKALAPALYSTAGAQVPTQGADFDFQGASVVGSRQSGFQDLRSGSPGGNTTATILHPVVGAGHFITEISMSFRYVAGYSPSPGHTKQASQLEVVALDMTSRATLATAYISPPLGNYSFDKYTGYSPPIHVKASGLRIPNAKPVLLQIRFINHQRNVQVQLDPKTGLNMMVMWSADKGPGKPEPAPKFLSPDTNGVVVTRGPLLFALHPKETRIIKKAYSQDLPFRPKAVDYEISTNDTWNYALVLDKTSPPSFTKQSSPGWSPSFAFDTENYPFSIQVKARAVPSWGFWQGSKITANLPPSPVRCGEVACGSETEVSLVPFGGTNIRIAVFPWTQ